MKISTSNFKFAIILFLFGINLHAQTDSIVGKKNHDSIQPRMNMDAIYNRPFLTSKKLPVAIGGYIEANTQYRSSDGVSDGLSFQMRRMTLFVSSTMGKKIKFFSELEFEEGTKEINLEYCAMDIEAHPLLNFRGGIIMNPIGAFNQNHDGPRWDFIDRPLTATGIIPSTLSNVGMGIHGKYFSHLWIIGYEFYLTNGFDDKLINNTEGRTSLHAGKENGEKFAESFNGSPLSTGKLAIRHRNIGEIGLSYMSGIYNKWQMDGLTVDNKRKASVFAVDYNTSLLNNRLSITGEYDRAMVQVPNMYTQQFGALQWGVYTDVIYTVLHQKMFGWEKAKLNLGARFEWVDYNDGRFRETKTTIGDDSKAIVPTVAFRPSGTTVIRLNYRFEWMNDLFNNPEVKTQTFQFGFSSYF
jgi:hypothetical protein